MSQFIVRWKDAGLWPQNPPNPDYPNGIDVDGSKPGEPSCKVDLKHPAPRIGAYQIQCKICGLVMMITTAGRPDDPRSVTLPCNPMARA